MSKKPNKLIDPPQECYEDDLKWAQYFGFQTKESRNYFDDINPPLNMFYQNIGKNLLQDLDKEIDDKRRYKCFYFDNFEIKFITIFNRYVSGNYINKIENCICKEEIFNKYIKKDSVKNKFLNFLDNEDNTYKYLFKKSEITFEQLFLICYSYLKLSNDKKYVCEYIIKIIEDKNNKYDFFGAVLDKVIIDNYLQN
mgnify:CR=1 FL=1